MIFYLKEQLREIWVQVDKVDAEKCLKLLHLKPRVESITDDNVE